MMNWRQHLIFTCVLLFSVVAVLLTYERLSQTADENFHVGCGLEWWENGKYTIHPMNPPVARVMASSLVHFLPPKDILPAGHTLAERYKLRTVLMRLGVLPFFILSCVMVLLLGIRLYNVQAALWALALYVTIPTVLAHAGFATTDMAYTAMYLWALLEMLGWLQHPTAMRSLRLGVSSALLVCTKFSALLHWPLTVIMILVSQAIVYDMKPRPPRMLTRRHGFTFPLAALAGVLTAGAIYHFSYGDIIAGMRELQHFNNHGFAFWFYGPLTNEGVWYFFPTVFFFKAPLAFHLLWGCGLLVILRQLAVSRGDNVRQLFPFFAAIAVLVPSMFSNINIGVRHVLPVFPLLALPAGYVIYLLWWRWSSKLVIILLLLWQLYACVRSFPEYVAYYNEAAGAHPERISLDSDFDWGQNISLLAKEIKSRGIDKVHVCAKSVKAKDRNVQFFMPDEALPCPKEEAHGWLALARARAVAEADRFAWVIKHTPVTAIGSTMDLYYIDAEKK